MLGPLLPQYKRRNDAHIAHRYHVVDLGYAEPM